MKLAAADIGRALRSGIAPIYLLFGEEPLQLGEAADAIRDAARRAGCSGWELFFVQSGFRWSDLRDAADSRSLFSERRLLDVRVPDKLDADAAAFLLDYAGKPPDDCVLVVSAGRLSSEDQKKAWFRSVEQAGVVVQARNLEGRQLLEWLDRRMSAKGLLADQAGLRLLAARVEGNLLAAAQEIEKLHVLFGSGQVSDQQIASVVADAARFDVYDLVDAVLGDMLPRSLRILDGLRGEGTPQPVVLWALARETRTLAALAFRIASGERMDAALARHQPRIWEQRRALVAAALRRLDQQAIHDALLLCSRADRIIKGQERGNGWSALTDVCVALTVRTRLMDASVAGGFR